MSLPTFITEVLRHSKGTETTTTSGSSELKLISDRAMMPTQDLAGRCNRTPNALPLRSRSLDAISVCSLPTILEDGTFGELNRGNCNQRRRRRRRRRSDKTETDEEDEVAETTANDTSSGTPAQTVSQSRWDGAGVVRHKSDSMLILKVSKWKMDRWTVRRSSDSALVKPQRLPGTPRNSHPAFEKPLPSTTTTTAAAASSETLKTTPMSSFSSYESSDEIAVMWSSLSVMDTSSIDTESNRFSRIFEASTLPPSLPSREDIPEDKEEEEEHPRKELNSHDLDVNQVEFLATVTSSSSTKPRSESAIASPKYLSFDEEEVRESMPMERRLKQSVSLQHRSPAFINSLVQFQRILELIYLLVKIASSEMSHTAVVGLTPTTIPPMVDPLGCIQNDESNKITKNLQNTQERA